MAKIIVLGSYDQSLINFRGLLLQTMVQEGHEVIACAPEISDDVRSKLFSIGVHSVSVPMNRTGITPVKDLVTFFILVKLFVSVKPDIILSYTIKPVIYGSLAARMAGIQKIYSMITGLGNAFTFGNLRQRLLGTIASLLYRISLKQNQKVFFQNPDDVKFFKELRFLSDPEKVVMINGSGVDLEWYKPVPLPGNCSFLLIARLIREKGVYDYVEAARMIKQKHPHVKFRLVGWLENSPSAITETELLSWKEEGIIEYLGKLDDVRPAIAETTVYVLPSYYLEGVPRTNLEAMAMGRPVITTDAPGCRETVIEGENGFLVPLRHPEALAQAMEKFVHQPEKVSRMGSVSRELAETKFNVHEVNKIIMKTIDL
ncbi:glycosyltransferase family 4 protein [Thermodesulfobacteriota bacterium]